jgi:hypothetical protein
MFWELPQNTVGLALLILAGQRVEQKEKLHKRFFIRWKGFAISLGYFIFWIDHIHLNDGKQCTNKAHEYGHAIQSMILGPLYLPLVGIPSVMRKTYGAWYFAMHRSAWKNYFAGFPEQWADQLGNKYFSNQTGTSPGRVA